MEKRILIHTLHGFLGSPSDWDFLENRWQFATLCGYAIKPKKCFDNWVNDFHNNVIQNIKTMSLPNKPLSILIGYSLGGRLALHELIANESSYAGAIIVSAHPGLKLKQDAEQRLIQDEAWKNIFQKNQISQALQLWNKQDVFKKSQCLIKNESALDKNSLSEILMNFSLGKQENLRPKIKKIKIPVLWITGQYDTKFTQLGDEVSNLNHNICHKILTQAGHRAPWDNTPAFLETCSQFFASVQQNA